jgi:hypothetical protein
VFEPAVVGLDVVVGIPFHVLPRRQNQFIERPRTDRRRIRDHLRWASLSACSTPGPINRVMLSSRRPRSSPPRSAFTGFRFPAEVIVACGAVVPAVRLSFRDIEELLAERGVDVDHFTVYWWVQRFAPLLADAAQPCPHLPGDRWFVDETPVKTSHEFCLSSSGF